jgi:alpha-L-rhamnosidase
MFGSISGWFHRWLGGIQVAEDAVGADRIVIRPQTVGALGHVKCSHRMIRGLIQSNWREGEWDIEFDIVIPPDTSATIELPANPNVDEVIMESGKPLAELPEIKVLPRDPFTHRFAVGSGHYKFTIPR